MSKNAYTFFITIILLGLTSYTKAQVKENENIRYHFIDHTPKFKIKHNKKINSQKDLKTQFLDHGYLAFSIDSTIIISDTVQLFIYSGKRYKLKTVTVDQPDLFNLNKSYLAPRTLSSRFIEQTNQHIINELHNTGHPYAVFTKELNLKNENIALNYSIIPGATVSFDSIKTIPSGVINYNYLSKKTGIKYGSIYNKKAVSQIKSKIVKTGLFKVDTVYSSIYGTISQNIIKVKPIKQNTFSALVGLQNSNNNKTEFTGNANINLRNIFKKGTHISMDWKKPSDLSQLLNIYAKLPYIYKLPIGSSLELNIDKKDSTFTNTDIKIGINSSSVNYGEFSIFSKWISSTVNTSIETTLQTSETKLYGMGYNLYEFNNPFLPTKGYSLNSEIYFGSYKLSSNASNGITSMAEILAQVNIAIPLPIGSIYLENNAALILNDSIKTNNLYRLGGTNSIRGFNEKSIYAKHFAFTKAELRIPIGNDSYLYLLNDFGIFNSPNQKSYKNTYKHAIGTGLKLNTSAGVLSISYALGRDLHDNFKLNEGKIHIGYTNTF